MATRPASLLTWATSGSAEILEPPAAKKAIGHIPSEPAAAPLFNWFWSELCDWIEFLDYRVTAYDDLADLVAGTTVGDSAELNENDLASLPGPSLSTITAIAAVLDVAVDGQYVYIATAAVVTKYPRAGGAAVTTYTPTNVGTVARVVVNGDRVAVAYGNFVELFTATTGVSAWSLNHGAAVRDIAIDAVRVYMVGAPDPVGFRSLRALIISGGTAWTYQHGGVAGTETLWSVATDGRSVFVAGDTTALGSGANVRALNASNGAGATTEGGTAADTAGLAWDATSATDIGAGGCLAVDGERLYLGFQSGVNVESRSPIYGDVLSSGTLTSVTVTRLSVDQGFLLVGGAQGGAGRTFALAKAELSTAWRYNPPTGVSAVIASDGAAAFVGYSSTVGKVSRGNRPGRWLRVDPDDLGLPFRWLAIPER